MHLPLTEKTAGMLDRAALARMKPDAVPVNTSRGGVVDEAALVDALCSGALAAAGLDVFALEPIPADNPLLGLDNVVLTPHVTWYTVDRRSGRLQRTIVMVVRQTPRSAAWVMWVVSTCVGSVADWLRTGSDWSNT